MVDSDIPDKFSIITYVSQFYHLLKVRNTHIYDDNDLSNSKDNNLTLVVIKRSNNDENYFDEKIQDEDDSRSPSLARAALRHSVSDQVFFDW